MIKFKGLDYSFCANEYCNKKETCMRWIKHYDIKEGDRISVLMMTDLNCNLYINNEESDDEC